MPELPWSAAESVPGPEMDCSQPALAAIGDQVHVAWHSDDTVYHAVRDDTSGWSRPAAVAFGEQPALAATPDGRLHCLFVNRFVESYQIYHTVWSDHGWSLPENVSHSGHDATQPALAAGPDGALHAAWVELAGGEASVYYGRRDEQFWTAEPVPNGRGQNPVLAAAPDGALYLAWRDLTAATTNDVLCTLLTRGAWSLPENVSDSAGGHSLHPVLAAGPQGLCHLVWLEQAGRHYAVQHSARLAGGWTTPATISPAGQDCLAPRLAISAQGMAQAIWAAGSALHHCSRNAGPEGTWSEPEVAVEGCARPGDLAFVIDRANCGHMVWTSLDAGQAWQLGYAHRTPLLHAAQFLPHAGR